MENLNDLYEPYVKSRRVNRVQHPTLPLYLYTYSKTVQFTDDWDENVTRSRGLLVDFEGRAVNSPMPKVFNFEQVDKINFDVMQPATVQSKLDGSMIVLSVWRGIPIIHSKGSFTSDQAAAAKSWLFEHHCDGWINPHQTYSFEWIEPSNRIVVDYGSRTELVLLRATCNLTGEVRLGHEVHEWSGDSPYHFDVEWPSYADLKREIYDDEEGWVVTFRDGNMLKIKGEEYLRLHRLRSNLTSHTVWKALENVADYEVFYRSIDDEALPWVRQQAERFRAEKDNWFRRVSLIYQNAPARVRADRKEFSEWLKEHVDKDDHALLWMLHDNKLDHARRYVHRMIEPEKGEAFGDVHHFG